MTAPAQLWRRYRFFQPTEDYRPVTFPPPGPYWCSGSRENDHVLIAFLPPQIALRDWWPEAHDEEYEEVAEITYTSRFPKPSWWMGNDRL